MTAKRRLMRHSGNRRARLVPAALAVAAAAYLGPIPAWAQQTQPARPSEITILSSPPKARLMLDGPSAVDGYSPLDLPVHWTGRFQVRIDAPGYATVRGLLYFPPRGANAYALSESPSLSAGLLLHSLNFPGVPALSTHHTARGVAFLAAGAGGLAATARDHLRYRDKVDEQDVLAQDRARDYRYARNRWAAYTGAVWTLSALDYIIRPRVDLLESTPTRVTLGAPRIGRAGVVWRSILVPGAGQDFANRHARGLIWLGLTLASGGAYTIAEESHHRIDTKLSRAKQLLATSGPTELAARQADVGHYTSLKETSGQLTDGLLIGTIAVYVANVFDAATSSFGKNELVPPRKISLTAPITFERAAFAVTTKF